MHLPEPVEGFDVGSVGILSKCWMKKLAVAELRGFPLASPCVCFITNY